MAGACSWQRCCLDGVCLCLRPESQVPHLRWSQAPPLPWQRPGSADYGLMCVVCIMKYSFQIVCAFHVCFQGMYRAFWTVFGTLHGMQHRVQNPGSMIMSEALCARIWLHFWERRNTSPRRCASLQRCPFGFNP